MQVIRRADQRVVPWRNGRGRTIEIAVYPPGSTDFEWRISSAAVTEDAPFSSFPGIDRTLVLLSGLLVLEREGGHAVRLDRRYAMISFPGEVSVMGRVPLGPAIDLNIMTRRDRWTHTVSVGWGALSAGIYVALEPSTVAGVALAPGDAAIAGAPVDVIGLVVAITLLERVPEVNPPDSP
jgi:environmental stress-induced protein Ves